MQYWVEVQKLVPQAVIAEPVLVVEVVVLVVVLVVVVWVVVPVEVEVVPDPPTPSTVFEQPIDAPSVGTKAIAKTPAPERTAENGFTTSAKKELISLHGRAA